MASVSVKVVPKTGFLSRFSLFKRSQEKFSFDYQVKCVEKAISDVQILQSIPFSSTPQLHLTTISNEIKPKLSDIANESLAAKLSLIHGVLSKNISDYEEQVKETLSTPLDQPVDEDKQAATLLYYRLVFTRNYLKSLEQAVKKGDIPANSLDKKIVGILDCSLRGTSSERVLGEDKQFLIMLFKVLIFYFNFYIEHLNLYGTQIQQDTLQLAFYTLYEPEIQTTASLLPLYPFQRQKKQTKINAKLASTYLLDKLELNTKTRCVFAWSGKPT